MTEPAVEAHGLCKVYPGKPEAIRAVDGLDLRVEPGEIFGLLGPNGAGKTSTVRMLCGLIRPTSGDARIDGLPVATQAREVRRRIGLVPEDAGNHKNLSVDEELAYHGALHGLTGAEIRARSTPLLERLGIADRRRYRLRGFSKGMRRKVHLARALLHRPRLLLLDEPTAGLDPAVCEEVWELLRDLAARDGVTVILCSHHLEEVERLCGRIAILKRRLLVEGTLAQLAGSDGYHRLRMVGPAEPAVQALAGQPRLEILAARDGELRFRADGDLREVVPQAVQRLVAAGVQVLALERETRDLRSLYRRIVLGDVGNGDQP